MQRIRTVASVLNQIGVGGLNIEIATDNELFFMDLVEKGLRKSNARAYYWRNISEYRPRRRVLNVQSASQKKEYTPIGWPLSSIASRIALESPLLGYLDQICSPPFVDPRESLENPAPEGVLEDDIPVFPSPSPVDPHPVAEPSAPSAAAAPVSPS